MCCLLSYKQSCDMCVLSASVCRQWTGWQEQDGEVAAGRFHVFFWVIYIALSSIKAYYPDMLSWWWGRLLRPLFHQGLPLWHIAMVMRTFTLPSLSPRPTTLTCCRGDQVVYFALTSTKVYHSDILPWWWGRWLCPHFHQGLPLWHIAMVMRAFTLPSLPPRSTTLTYCHGDEGVDFALTFTKA